MIAAEEVALILLAAGRSTRFGDGASKLDAPLEGRPLGLHVADTLATIPFARRIAVVKRGTIDYAAHGFAVIANDDPVGDMASSLRLGATAARDAAAVLIVLADMPRLTATHVCRLLATASGAEAIVASSNGGAPRPPALFGSGWLDRLTTLSGDQGARALIRTGLLIPAAPGELVDIDTPADLSNLSNPGGQDDPAGVPAVRT